jgi:predicted SprT family Zn-dependent metalloprotease
MHPFANFFEELRAKISGVHWSPAAATNKRNAYRVQCNACIVPATEEHRTALRRRAKRSNCGTCLGLASLRHGEAF